MRILFTSHALDPVSEATLLPIRELASRMSGRDHDVICFSRTHGDVAEALKNMGIAVVAEMAEIPVGWEPDIIHGHHEWETTIAAMRFPTCPIISICRSTTDWKEAPCTAPNVLRYVAVDLACREKLQNEDYISSAEIDLIPHGVDLYRFPEREKYRKKLETVFVFGDKDRQVDYFEFIRQACESEGVAYEFIDDPNVNTAGFLPFADLVFASGKIALEAAATGAMVAVCGEAGLAGNFLMPDNFVEMRERNFEGALIYEPHSVDAYRNRIRDYNPKMAKKVCRLVRETADIERTIDQLEAIYEHAVKVWKEGHGEDLATFETFTEWAALYFEKKTWAYKTGRESQHIWRNTAGQDPEHASRYAAPFTPVGEKVESNRITETLREFHPTKLILESAENELARMGKTIPEVESS